MDGILAKKMGAALIGNVVGGWGLEGFTGAYGNSALVFTATRGGLRAAVKIFDPDLIERFGRDVQAERIRRQLTLRDKDHPNLVKILDGGHSDELGLWFIVMEFLDAPSMSKVLCDIPRDNIRLLISQVASAAKFLEYLGIVHRDIKPDNIAVQLDFERCILLDVGVIRPFAAQKLTDEADQKRFIGTLQYGSPEFIFRTEKDTPEGWRAVTFYQLGAVLHDIIMKRPLFEESLEPYTRLVEAVRHSYPRVAAADVSPDLVLLARNCLHKDPELRLKFVEWGDFEPVRRKGPTADAKDRLRKRQAHYMASREGSMDEQQRRRSELRTLTSIRARIQEVIRAECISSDLFPPMEIHYAPDELVTARFVVWFGVSEGIGLSQPLSFMFEVVLLDQQSEAIELRCAAALMTKRDRDSNPGLTTVEIFRGVFDEAAIGLVLQEVLYPTLDRALETLEDLRAGGEPGEKGGAIVIPVGERHG